MALPEAGVSYLFPEASALLAKFNVFLPREECFKAGSVVVNFHAAIGKTKSCSPGVGER